MIPEDLSATPECTLMDVARTMALGDTILFVGAGFSVAAGAPSVEELADHLRSKLRLPQPEWSLALVAELYRQRFGPYALYSSVRNKLLERDLVPTRLHELLCALPVRTFVTTNCDQLIEHALRAAGRSPHVLVGSSDFTADAGATPQVIKLHGDLNRPDTLVVAQGDHPRCLNRTTPLRRQLLDLLRTRPACFVGYSLRDPDIALLHSQVRRDVGGFQPATYLLTPESDWRLHTAWRRRGVQPITVKLELGDWSRTLVAALERLVAAIRPLAKTTDDEAARCDVLVVNADAGIRLMYKNLLERRLNVRVETASDGMDACLRLPNLIPKLILFELVTSRKDRWRLVDVVQGDRKYHGTQFVIVSKHVTRQDAVRASAMGIPYLTADCTLDEIVALVELKLAIARSGPGGPPAST